MTSTRLDFDRAERWVATVDRFPLASPAGTDRMLLQVYEGGAMPDSPGRVFLGRPAAVSHALAEGSNYSVAADGSRSVPFVAFGRGPDVGDVLVVHRIGGVWVAMAPNGQPPVDPDCPLSPPPPPPPPPTPPLNFTWRLRYYGGAGSPDGSGPIVTYSSTLPPSSSSTNSWGYPNVTMIRIDCESLSYQLGVSPFWIVGPDQGVLSYTESPWSIHFLTHDHDRMKSGFRLVELTLTI